MQVLVLSDFHGHSQAFSKAAETAKKLNVDVIVICGDVTNFGHTKEAEALLKPLTTLNIPLLYVPGNCDLSSFLEETIDNTQNLHANAVKLSDYVFIGVGGAPSSHLHTPLEFPEEWLMIQLKKATEHCAHDDKLIVCSHTPPYNTKIDQAFMNTHIGSHSLKRFIEEKKPIAVFCGHVHEAPGIDKLGETLLVNPGPAKNGKYALVKLTETVEVKLGTFQ